MITLIEKFHTYFGLKLSVLVFGITELLSVTLQGVNTNTKDCLAVVYVTIQGLTRYKSDEMFEIFQRRLNYGVDGHSFGSVHEYYRKKIIFRLLTALKVDLSLV